MRKLLLAFALSLIGTSAFAQNIQCPTRAPNDNSNACASTAYVSEATGGTPIANSVLATDGSAVPHWVMTLPSGLIYPTPTLTGLTTVGNQVSTTTAGIPDNFSGETPNVGLVYNLTANAALPNTPEVTGVFSMTSSVGGSNVLHYRQALGAEVITNAGSAPTWAFTAINTANTGYAVTTQNWVTQEIDSNQNTGIQCVNEDPGATGHYCAGTVWSGAGANQLTAANIIAGLNKYLVGTLYSSQGPALADIESYSPASTGYLDVGTHANGINFSGATLSANFLVGPSANFFVTNTGAVTSSALTAPSMQSNGTVPSGSGSCAINTQVGGKTAGSFKANGVCAAGTVILALPTMPNGWNCDAADMTTTTDTLKQTAYTTVSVTFLATMASADQVVFKCMGF